MSTTPKTTPARILIVGDQAPLRTRLRHVLEVAGHEVGEAPDEPAAARSMRAARPVVVLTDLHLSTGDGFGVLRAAKDLDPDLPVIAMTALAGIEDAVAAMRAGALDCFATPVDPERLLPLVERAVERRRTVAEHLALKQELAAQHGVPRIVGRDPALTQVLTSVERAAATDATVLLEGQSGTGKELFARTLHAFSRRAAGPFVAINCAAIPESLLESELFGHEKGAFTGAEVRKLGKFEVAHGGTLFLDEIGDLAMSLQAKILRAVETRSFERVGGTKSQQVDVRMVAATNRGLRARVAAGEFREDLFFRLSVFPIQIPPLHERSADVPLLARFFVERSCKDLEKPTLTLSPAAEDRLTSYGWPGNVRELENCVQRAVILCDESEIRPEHLDLGAGRVSAPAADPWGGIDLSGSLADASRRVLAELEQRKILEALRKAGSNTGRAADALQISHRALIVKMQEYGITLASRVGRHRRAGFCLSACFRGPLYVAYVHAASGVPDQHPAVSAAVRRRGGVRAVPGGVPLAGRLSVSTLRPRPGLPAGRVAAAGMRSVSLPGVVDSGHRLPPDEDAADGVVLGRVSDDDRQARDLGAAAATPAGHPSV